MITTFTSSIDLSSFRAVTLNSAGKVVYADHDTIAHAGKVLGITARASGRGNKVAILPTGEVYNKDWKWIIGTSVWLGNNGALTQTEPTTGFIQILGFPVTPTKLFLHMGGVVILNTGNQPLFVQDTAPDFNGLTGLWIETGLPDNGLTFWVEDGL